MPAQLQKYFSQILAFLVLSLLLWGMIAPIAGETFTPDSFAYQMLGQSIFSGGGFATNAIRDLSLRADLPAPSRSFPPLWPLILGALQKLTGLGMWGAIVLNYLVIWATFAATCGLARFMPSPSGASMAWALFPVFLFTDEDFRFEAAQVKAIPLCLLLIVLLLLALAGQTQAQGPRRRQYDFGIGVLCAALYLTRYDQLLCVGSLLLAFYFLQRLTGADDRSARFSSARVLLTFALLITPWALRNWLVFGSPLASDNSLTPLSLFNGNANLAFWKAGHPPTLFDDPSLWLNQRLHYLTRNLKALTTLSLGVFPLALVLAGVLWSCFSKVQKIWLLVAVLFMGVHFFTISLTPYPDLRYFAIPHFLVLFVLMISVGALAIGSSTKAINWSVALFLLALGVQAGAFKSVGRFWRSGIVPHNYIDKNRPIYAKIKADLMQHGFDPNSDRVAVRLAEELSYFTGLATVSIPENCDKNKYDENFHAWIKHFGVNYILAESNWLQRMPFLEWRVGKTSDGVFTILKVPTQP